ncbi:unnamed protein product [Amoebophrya sp. A120]|nr:unnamed protein product [Amoebophrya sp. A120]|eukprot:GSA120T00004885001.1
MHQMHHHNHHVSEEDQLRNERQSNVMYKNINQQMQQMELDSQQNHLNYFEETGAPPEDEPRDAEWENETMFLQSDTSGVRTQVRTALDELKRLVDAHGIRNKTSNKLLELPGTSSSSSSKSQTDVEQEQDLNLGTTIAQLEKAIARCRALEEEFIVQKDIDHEDMLHDRQQTGSSLGFSTHGSWSPAVPEQSAVPLLAEQSARSNASKKSNRSGRGAGEQSFQVLRTATATTTPAVNVPQTRRSMTNGVGNTVTNSAASASDLLPLTRSSRRSSYCSVAARGMLHHHHPWRFNSVLAAAQGLLSTLHERRSVLQQEILLVSRLCKKRLTVAADDARKTLADFERVDDLGCITADGTSTAAAQESSGLHENGPNADTVASKEESRNTYRLEPELLELLKDEFQEASCLVPGTSSAQLDYFQHRRNKVNTAFGDHLHPAHHNNSPRNTTSHTPSSRRSTMEKFPSLPSAPTLNRDRSLLPSLSENKSPLGTDMISDEEGGSASSSAAAGREVEEHLKWDPRRMTVDLDDAEAARMVQHVGGGAAGAPGQQQQAVGQQHSGSTCLYNCNERPDISPVHSMRESHGSEQDLEHDTNLAEQEYGVAHLPHRRMHTSSRKVILTEEQQITAEDAEQGTIYPPSLPHFAPPRRKGSTGTTRGTAAAQPGDEAAHDLSGSGTLTPAHNASRDSRGHSQEVDALTFVGQRSCMPTPRRGSANNGAQPKRMAKAASHPANGNGCKKGENSKESKQQNFCPLRFGEKAAMIAEEGNGMNDAAEGVNLSEDVVGSIVRTLPTSSSQPTVQIAPSKNCKANGLSMGKTATTGATPGAARAIFGEGEMAAPLLPARMSPETKENLTRKLERCSFTDAAEELESKVAQMESLGLKNAIPLEVEQEHKSLISQLKRAAARDLHLQELQRVQDVLGDVRKQCNEWYAEHGEQFLAESLLPPDLQQTAAQFRSWRASQGASTTSASILDHVHRFAEANARNPGTGTSQEHTNEEFKHEEAPS